MASIFDYLRQQAEEIAGATQERVSDLDREIAEIEKQKAKKEAERDLARGALKRLANFPVKNGADYLCPNCWVTRGGMSTLQPIPSPDRHDIFRCGLCGHELVI